ncbi:MAG: excalibur calcium-binding domain-containing protein [Bifidobacterium sp.]|jgi:hypothetical protein
MTRTMLPAAQRCGILIMSALITIGLFFVADPVRHANAAQAGAVPIYRVYNPHSGLHHYTKVAPERDHLAALGWRLEGVSFNAVGGGIPVYREYNPHDGNHNWTMNANEHRMLIRTGWHNEGVAWYAPSSGQDVYRLYNPHSGEHVYTSSYAEYLSVGRAGWHMEGVAWHSYGSITYSNCREEWAAVGHSIRRGDPGYSDNLDSDHDGVACESRPR